MAKNNECGFTASVSFPRTADTNIYAANDVIGAATGSTAALTFAGLGTPGTESIITTWRSVEPFLSPRFVYLIEDYAGLLDVCVFQAKDRGHGSFALRHGLLHDLSTESDQVDRGRELNGAGANECGELAEAVTRYHERIPAAPVVP